MSTQCHCCGREVCDGNNLYPGALYQLSFIEDGDMVWCNHDCYRKDTNKV